VTRKVDGSSARAGDLELGDVKPGHSTNGVSLENSFLTVTCYPFHGFVISAIVDRASGCNVLWNPPNGSLADLDGQIGLPGLASIASFDEGILVGGWFGMFPTAGLPGSRPDLWMHGEAPRLPWVVREVTETSVKCSVDLPNSGFHLERVVKLDGATVSVATTALNESVGPRSATFGEHPCFRRELFAGGRILLESGSRGTVATPEQPEAARYAGDRPFTWPVVPLAAGGFEDASTLPRFADARQDHLILEPSGSRMAIESPLLGCAVVIEYDPFVFRHALLWQHFLPDGSPWPGDVFAVEPSSAPGCTFDDAVAAGAVRIIEPGTSVSYWVSLRLERSAAPTTLCSSVASSGNPPLARPAHS
jgi:galactose mutarotase-like enzyme